MKKMDPREFRKYLEHTRIGPVTFQYQDQDWYDSFGVTSEFHCVFPKINMDICPTLLTLSGADTCVRFHGIDYIQVNRERGEILVHCKARLPDCLPGERTYTLSVNMQ